MTNNNIVSVPEIDPGSLSADDPRMPMARAVALAGAVISRVNSENETNPSPCPQWDAKAIAGHLVAILDRLAGFPGGIDAMTLPLVVEGVDPDQWPEVLETAAHAVHQAWSDDAVLGQEMVLPFATLPGAATLGIYTAELLTHIWDLAKAIAVEPEWHEGDVQQSLEIVQFGIPAEPRGGEFPFGAVTATDDDAPTIDKLAAWFGRRV
ncbi:MAG: TIGR03086 family metal-binding protein [Acidimicrobiales bacterium]